MELRELRAFVAAAEELHFARAAEQLRISPSRMSELIRLLELELGTSLFVRTTRRITLTDTGTELLGRARTILELVDQTTEAIQATSGGRSGTIALGITPPAAPMIAPHLAATFSAAHPEVTVEINRMWLPALTASLLSGAVDVALTCGQLAAEDPNVSSFELGSEQLLIGLRPEDPLARSAELDIHDFGSRTLGLPAADLFPAWHDVQAQVLVDAGLSPPTVELADTDLSPRLWAGQPDIEWIMLIGSLLNGHENTTARPARGLSIPFTLSWLNRSPLRPVVRRFLDSSRHATLPAGWLRPSATRP